MSTTCFPNILPDSFLSALRHGCPRDDISGVLVSLYPFEEIARSGVGWQTFLSQEEWQKALQYRLLKRKTEWIAGRYCAKKAAAQLAAPAESHPLVDIVVGNERNGRPFILSAPAPFTSGRFDISISHGSAFACSVAASRHCGVDIQAPQDTLFRVWDRFCTHPEEEMLTQSTGLDRLGLLTLLWAAKEAVRKCCSHTYLPGFLEIELREVIDSGTVFHLIFSAGRMELHTFCALHQGHGLAACLLPESSHA